MKSPLLSSNNAKKLFPTYSDLMRTYAAKPDEKRQLINPPFNSNISNQRMIVVAKNLHLPSQLWLRRNLENFKEQVSLIATDCLSFQQLVANGDARATCLWGQNPSLIRRISGRLLADSEKVWRDEPKLRLKKILKRDPESAVLIHFLDVAIEFEDLIANHKGPVFVYCHGGDFCWDLRDHQGRYVRSNPEVYRETGVRLCNRVKIITNSSWSRNYLIDSGVSPDQISVNYFGVSSPTIFPERSVTDRITILYLGRLIDAKGPDLTIKAFSKASSQGLNATLTIAGDGPLKQSCLSLARSLNCADRIKFLGSVSKRQGDDLRRQADIFTAHNQTGPVTGQTEAFGVSILEAMSEGLPVVTGKSGGITDMIDHEKNGILFESGDTTAHARALLELSDLQEKREHLGRAAWETARQQFSVELETSGLYSIIRGVDPNRENQFRSPTVNSLDKS